jgi:Holliday junction resolvase
MTNYTRGRSREYQTMHLLRDDGWMVSRSAMSHGPVDVFAAKNGIVKLIQVKSGSSRMKKGDLEILGAWATAFNAKAEVWYYKKRGRLQKIPVKNSSPNDGGVMATTSSVPPIPL